MRVLRFLGPEKYWPRRGHISFALTEGYIIFLFTTIFATDFGNILTQTGLVARGVLLLLLLFSIISWAMILQKLGLFGRIRRESDQFLRIFRATRGVANPQALATAGSPFSSVYAAGYRELQSQVGTAPGNPHPPKLKSLQAVTVSMQLATADEVRRVEKGMSWLATTGSVTPFMVCSEPCGASSTRSPGWAAPVPPVCAPSLRASPRRWSPPPRVFSLPSRR